MCLPIPADDPNVGLEVFKDPKDAERFLKLLRERKSTEQNKGGKVKYEKGDPLPVEGAEEGSKGEEKEDSSGSDEKEILDEFDKGI